MEFGKLEIIFKTLMQHSLRDDDAGPEHERVAKVVSSASLSLTQSRYHRLGSSAS